ncbi:MAG: hypothetical protein M0C28_38025 [Candidatus Moduliflexus flocculans]|nr:hypothetical protein [Candidatus Moduliflexus flocculans]
MRKTVLLVLTMSLAVWGCRDDRAPGPEAKAGMTTSTSPAGAPFVTVADGRFTLGGKPHYFVGANFWQGMNLGVDGPSGDRPRLLRELDRLRDLGVTNLRVMASSEGPNTEPYRMVPALMTAPGEYDGSVLDGLDFLLAEMGKRGLRAVMVLNNFWQWSGGMAQYVSWHEKTPIPYPGDYEKFIAYSARFYTYPECQDWFRAHIAMLVDRTNPYTGRKYRDDPAVFSWELGERTAALPAELDRRHRPPTSNPSTRTTWSRPAPEGAPPGEPTQDFVQDAQRARRSITSPSTSGPRTGAGTIRSGLRPSRPPSRWPPLISEKHAKEAEAMGKPLVLEEFGLAREWAAPARTISNPASPTTTKDLYYAALYKLVDGLDRLGRPGHGRQLLGLGGRGQARDDLGRRPAPRAGRLVFGLRRRRLDPGRHPGPRGGDRRADEMKAALSIVVAADWAPIRALEPVMSGRPRGGLRGPAPGPPRRRSPDRQLRVRPDGGPPARLEERRGLQGLPGPRRRPDGGPVRGGLPGQQPRLRLRPGRASGRRSTSSAGAGSGRSARA